jgi:hypothetical protein
MSTKSQIDWLSLRTHFVISFASSLLFAVVIYFGCNFVNDSHQGILLAAAAGLLWCICAWRSLHSTHILHIFTVAAGLTWGFLLSMSAAISIQNHRDSINWPTMIPGLLLIPVFATITVLPFWYLGKKREKGGNESY